MTPWEFSATVDGWNRAHESGPRPPSPEEHDALVRRFETVH